MDAYAFGAVAGRLAATLARGEPQAA